MPSLLRLLPLCILLAVSWSCQDNEKSPSEDVPPPSQPHIVFIIADDVGWDDLGIYGNKQISTPNLDQLAAEGMRFDQAFLTTSSCSPSRTSILSGLYPHNTDAEQLSWPLPADKPSFVRELKKAGYWTGLAGKYHMGDAVRPDFDLLYEMQWKDAPIGIDRRLVGDGSGCDDWIRLLQERPKDQPLFAWLASFDAHRPFYEETSDDPHPSNQVHVPPYMPETDSVKKDFALYYDEIMRLDRYVGEVMAELEAQGIAEQTLVLFISDNGRAFPRDKTTLYDGGIKTPWILRWPTKVAPGSSSHYLVSSVDIAPSFMQVAGLAPLSEFNGKSFLPLLEEEATPIRREIYAEDHFHDFEDYTRAVRTERYKYIKNFYPDLPNTPSADIIRDLSWQSMKAEFARGKLNPAQSWCFDVPRPEEELYDVLADPYELNNLAGQPEHEETLNDLRVRLDSIRLATEDFLPKTRTPDDFFRETGLPTRYRIRPRPSKAVYMQALEEGVVLSNPDWVD